MFRKNYLYLCLVVLLSWFASAQATTYTTIAAGDWDDSSIWEGGSAPGVRLGGHVVNINHRVEYPNSLGDMFIENGTLNINHIFKVFDVNIKMFDSAGQVNFTDGLLILTNNSFENKAGTVTFDFGSVQLCNGGYLVDGGQSTGNGFIFDKAGDINNTTGSSSDFSPLINWCTDNGSGNGLPTAENCGIARPPGGDCLNEQYYTSLLPDYDYSDAPAGYGEVKHIIPATPTVYLGAIAPDDENASMYSGLADGDDNGATDDEDAFTSLIDLDTSNTSYSLAVPCSGSGTVAGWIDFDQSGTFTNISPNERVSAACSGSSATLDWNSANSNYPASITLGSSYARLRIASDAADVVDPTGRVHDGEVEDYPIALICPYLSGDVSEVAPAIPLQLLPGKKVFVGSRTQSPAQGHLKAFAIQTDHSLSASAAWDAATLMDTSERQNNLYSTNSSGTKILFNDLDDAAFSTGTPSVATIKSYTLTPSYDSGTYLAGRESGSFLGSLSRGNSLGLVEQAFNISLFLKNNNYRTYYNGTISSRSEKVLATTDDGFLYVFNQTDGELSWGWIPRSLTAELKDFASFQSNHFMRGKLNVIDVTDGTSYATYIVGAYKNGLGHYVLKLDASAGLDSVIWDEDSSASFISAPNQGEAAFFQDGLGNTWVTYVITDSSANSTLVIHNILTAAKTEVALNFNATSTPFIMPDFGNTGGPASKTLYLGDSNGNIHRTALLSVGVLDTAANLKTALESTPYSGELGASEAILFLGASVSSSNRKYYLRAQSQSRLTVLQYNSSTSNWIKRWTSYVGGAGTWDISGTTFTADTSGAPTDDDGDGIATNVTANGIQSLPAGAKITDTAKVVADTIILPVSATEGRACFGTAFLFLYRLTDGTFPDNKLFGADDGVAIDENLFVGYGEPTRVEVSDVPSNNQMRGYGSADQAEDNSTKPPKPFVINDSVSTGLRGWKELKGN